MRMAGSEWQVDGWMDVLSGQRRSIVLPAEARSDFFRFCNHRDLHHIQNFTNYYSTSR